MTLKKSHSVKVGRIYLAGYRDGGGPVKIGFSWGKAGLQRRLNMLLAPSQRTQFVPEEIDRARVELLAYCENGTFALERAVQGWLAPYSVGGEWFSLRYPLTEFESAAWISQCGPVTAL
jgi:hypothetical protein